MSKSKTMRDIALLESATPAIQRVTKALRKQNAVALSVIRKSTPERLTDVLVSDLLGDEYNWVTSSPFRLRSIISSENGLEIKNRNHQPRAIPYELLQMSDRDFATKIRRAIMERNEARLIRRRAFSVEIIQELREDIGEAQDALEAELKHSRVLDAQVESVVRAREERTIQEFDARRR